MKLRLLSVAVFLFLLGAGAIAWSHLRRPGGLEQEGFASSPQETAAAPAQQRVVLSESKLSSLGLRVAPAAFRSMQELHPVAGRISYNNRRRVDLVAVAAGIASDVRVSPGERVVAGQVLAVVSSPEIAAARVGVQHAHERWELANRKAAWQSEIARNVAALLDEIKSRVPIAELERRFKDRTLGKSRDALLSAYSRFQLAEKFAKTMNDADSSALPVATVQQRDAERRSAHAGLLAACEQSAFDVSQEKRSADVEAKAAEREFNIAQEQLRSTLGYWPDTAPQQATEGNVLARVEIRAPFAGTIEEKRLARSARVQKQDTLFVLADTTTLWVVADLREQDWRALALSPGEELTVSTPALPDRRLVARVDHFGRQVDRESNSVPLVAEISNADGLLRPGLFVQVSIPVGTPKEMLCVPATALASFENARFVFERESPTAFRRVDVTTGMQNDDWIQVVSGVSQGAPIVVQGATALKAEMLVPKMKKDD